MVTTVTGIETDFLFPVFKRVGSSPGKFTAGFMNRVGLQVVDSVYGYALPVGRISELLPHGRTIRNPHLKSEMWGTRRPVVRSEKLLRQRCLGALFLLAVARRGIDPTRLARNLRRRSRTVLALVFDTLLRSLPEMLCGPQRLCSRS